MSSNDAAPLIEAERWDEFVCSSKSGAGFKQSSWWANFLASRGSDHFSAVFSDDQGLVGGGRVLVESFAPGKGFYYVPHGPLLPDDEEDARQVFEAFLEDIDQHRREDPQIVSHLRFEPRWERLPAFVEGYHTPGHWIEPRDTLCVDLSAPEDAILAQMKPKGRYNIGVARRKGVAVVEDTSAEGVADFLALYKQTFERHGKGRHSSSYIEELAATLFPRGRGSIFFAEYEGLRLATALIIYFGDTATYKYGGSQLTHRSVMAPYLLHYEVMRRAKALGHRWYDFYGVSAPDQPNDSWAAFSAFKRKFGGREVHFVPTLDYVYDPDAYREYQNR